MTAIKRNADWSIITYATAIPRISTAQIAPLLPSRGEWRWQKLRSRRENCYDSAGNIAFSREIRTMLAGQQKRCRAEIKLEFTINAPRTSRSDQIAVAGLDLTSYIQLKIRTMVSES